MRVYSVRSRGVRRSGEGDPLLPVTWLVALEGFSEGIDAVVVATIRKTIMLKIGCWQGWDDVVIESLTDLGRILTTIARD